MLEAAQASEGAREGVALRRLDTCDGAPCRARLSPDHKRCERILDERAAFCAERLRKPVNPSPGSAEK